MESISKEIDVSFFFMYNPFGVRRSLKMIPSRRAPSRVNTSPYRAIWTHFRPTFISVGQTTCQILVPKSKCFLLNGWALHLATLINIWHVQEPRSQKVSMEQINLRKHTELLTCYKLGRSKTLSQKGCMGSDFSRKKSKLAFYPVCVNSIFLGETKKLHLCRRLELSELRRTTA